MQMRCCLIFYRFIHCVTTHDSLFISVMYLTVGPRPVLHADPKFGLRWNVGAMSRTPDYLVCRFAFHLRHALICFTLLAFFFSILSPWLECFPVLKINQHAFSFLIWLDSLLPFAYCQTFCRAHEQFGYCQAGTSGMLLDDDTALIGTPGPYTWRGTVFAVSVSDDFLHRDKTLYYGPLTQDHSPVDKYSYLGMAIFFPFYSLLFSFVCCFFCRAFCFIGHQHCRLAPPAAPVDGRTEWPLKKQAKTKPQ